MSGPPPPIKLRAAQAPEAEQLSALALRSKAHWGYSKTFMDAVRNELSYSAEDVGRGPERFVVAERESRLIGFYALGPLEDRAIELEALFVDPDFIGMGYGRKLIAHALEYALVLGASRMIIQGDPHADAFYLAAGANRIGSRPSQSIPGRSLPLFEIELQQTVGNTAKATRC